MRVLSQQALLCDWMQRRGEEQVFDHIDQEICCCGDISCDETFVFLLQRIIKCEQSGIDQVSSLNIIPITEVLKTCIAKCTITTLELLVVLDQLGKVHGGLGFVENTGDGPSEEGVIFLNGL